MRSLEVQQPQLRPEPGEGLGLRVGALGRQSEQKLKAYELVGFLIE